MQSETKACQNCEKPFTIEPEDFSFYEKMQVPTPTFCPWCRFIRRTMFRNERVLYKRTCDLCKQDTITIYSPDNPRPVYCNPCWWSDAWDPLAYGRDYDPDRNFFEQFSELEKSVPHPGLVVTYTTLVNSDYVNHSGNCKNCYLIFDTDFAENVSYATIANRTKDSMDVLCLESSELCYEDVNCEKCFNVSYSEDCNDCHSVYFSKNLSGCSNCVGCVNLRNQQYHIFNEPYSRESYEQKLRELNLGSHAALGELRKKAHAFWRTFPAKFMHGTHNTNVSGDYIFESKNAEASYICRGVEDSKYCYRVSVKPTKDAYDYFEWGDGAEKIYECITVGGGASNMRFCVFCTFSNSLDVEYCMGALSCRNVFACGPMRKQQYCILNKQYSEEEYFKLRERIIKDMNERPYTDRKGRIWKYGEFFPYDFSPFGYNESTAMQYEPLSKEEVEEKGWPWYEREEKKYGITRPPAEIPDLIEDAQDAIIKDILECAACRKAYRIIKPELELLRRFGLPLPRECPECRHMRRFRRLNPPREWKRGCMCSPSEDQGNESYKNTNQHFHGSSPCPNDFETAFAPDRPEIVYCEQCYQAEVA